MRRERAPDLVRRILLLKLISSVIYSFISYIAKKFIAIIYDKGERHG